MTVRARKVRRAKPTEADADAANQPDTNESEAAPTTATEDAPTPTTSAAAAAGPERLAYSRKVCVVGPNGWGKTSLVQSLVAQAPSLATEEDRTLGIELHRLSFTQEETATSSVEYTAMVWDFAGQDVYQSAHALFFSKESFYLLCVDVEACSKALAEADALSLRQGEALRSRFMTKNIFSWLRLIFARDPSAEVMLVGTKTDLVPDEKTRTNVWLDIKLQLNEWKRRYIEEIEVELRLAEESAAASVATSAKPSAHSIKALASTSHYSGNAHHASSFEELRDKVNAISFDEWLPVSCNDQGSIDLARQTLEAKLTASDHNVDLSGRNGQVLEVIQKRRDAAAQLTNAREQIESNIVPLHALFTVLVRQVEGLDHADCNEVLRALHHLGEIAWFDHENAGPLKDVVILDPTIVISLVREALNHDHAITSHDSSITHFEEGRVSHDILSSFPTWKDLDTELMHAFKLLLQYFHLAYPASDQEVDWDSDLIVPSYWKVRKPAVDKRLLQQRTMMAQNGVVAVDSVCWEYELSTEVSEMVFEQFAVQSYTTLFQRTVWPNCIESFAEGDFASRVALSPGEMNRDIICVEVAVEDANVGWKYLRYYAMTLEKVLDNYPGLSVSRYIVDVEGERHRLNVATRALEDAVRRGQDEKVIRDAMPWLPPDLNWFMEKAWRHPGKLQELQMRELVKQTVHRLDVLKKLVVASDSQRKYPALWTLEYSEVEKAIVLKMLSDLSGQCFHAPIRLDVPPQFLAKYGTWLQNGLWVCSNVVPEVVSLGIVQKVVDWISPTLESHIDRATSIHSMIMDLDLQGVNGFNSKSQESLSAKGTVALLRDILKLHNGDFDELTICDLSNLECAATADGHYIWAHRHEIMSMGDELTPCDRDDFKLSSAVAEDDDSQATTDPAQDPPASPTNSKDPAASPTTSKDPTASPPSPTASVASTASTSTTVTSLGSSQSLTSSSAKIQYLPLSLQFETASGLTEWDWRRTYCKWQLLYGETSTPLASGVTAQHADISTSPDWKSSPAFNLSCIISVEMLRQCRLALRLKRPSRFVVTTKLIGEGSIYLRDVIGEDAVQNFGSQPLEVPIGDGTTPRSVTCTLSLV